MRTRLIISTLTVPDGVQYVNQICAAGTTLYASVGMQGEEIVNSDPVTGETWSYYNTRLAMLTIDPDTGTCMELTNLDLPQVPEGADGSVDCYNMIGSDDGTLWMLVNVYATQFDLPDDFDPEHGEQSGITLPRTWAALIWCTLLPTAARSPASTFPTRTTRTTRTA